MTIRSAMRSLRLLASLGVLVCAPAWGTVSLTALTGFGTNPGNLDAFTYAPASVGSGAPLVVVLHGCTQTASGLLTTGIVELADERGLVLLLPQQKSANNPMTCFNWGGEYGDPANLVRGQGENESIRQMVDAAQTKYGTAADRVYAIGFSSGGGMAAILAATWPERFAGVAIMSGVPYRCAADLNTSYSCMQGSVTKTAAQWGDLVRAAYPAYSGPYPRIALFQGAADTTVSPKNFAELVKQWGNVHGLPETPASTDTIGQVEHAVYGPGLVTFKVGGMGHAVAVGSDPDHPCGTAGAFVESRGLCSMYRALEFFGEATPAATPDGGPPVTTPDGGPPETPDGSVDPSGDTTPPTVTLDTPAAGAEVAGAVTIEATAHDDVGLARVEFWVDGILKGSAGAAPYTYRWNTTFCEVGAHVVLVKAYDRAGNTAEAQADVTVVRAAASGDGGVGDGAALREPIPCGSCSSARRHGGPVGLAALAVLALALRGGVTGLRRGRRS
jgi:poly(hydroxyalkanoate) depolymerase family esterase